MDNNFESLSTDGQNNQQIKETKTETHSDRNVVPEEINKMLSVWLSYFKRWYSLHYTLGLAAMVLALILTADVTSNHGYSLFINDYREVFAICSAIASGAVTFLGAHEKATSYTNAWRILHCAKIKYLFEGATRGDLAEAYKQGEDVIRKCK